ncbi:interferon regulatory factor 4-like isoform X1 [Cygnus atratus]|uniref:interferon regulatory factor 4-like isoform X1 n=1 Tax=Cygnus atratus TaxID=8868 RepID=UPI0015D60ED8|nr:interferon regulatory factor 4-like isoform X1 [Cygnus atratus]
MAEPGSPMRLKEWLIAQIDSGRYPGLRWEDGRRTLFRIPWKHAAKQDYRQQQDAALFRAWAVYKGKYHEGTDKADPSTWKTRLRCALNKSTDFQEVPERSQLDISEPYKVYQIVSDGARDAENDGGPQPLAGEDLQGRAAGSPAEEGVRGAGGSWHGSALPLLSAHPAERGEKRALGVGGVTWDGAGAGGHCCPAGGTPFSRALCPWEWRPGLGLPSFESQSEAAWSCTDGFNEVQQRAAAVGSTRQPWGLGLGQDPRGQLPTSLCHLRPDPGYHIRGVFYGWNPTHGHFLPRPPSYLPVEDVNHSDCWLHVRLYYCDVLVKELTTRTAEGCRIASRAESADSERLYGPSCMEQIEFPPPRALGGSSRVAGVTEVLERLLPHLERGVLLWVAPEGVFMKRQCQGRVYWNGPLAPHRDWPNKLEREKTYKLLDTQQFLQQLRRYLSQGQPAPQYQIHLCFGEEYPTSASHHFQKLIMAHVEPVFARELFHHAQRIGPTLLRDCPQPCAPGAPGHIVHVLQQLCQP